MSVINIFFPVTVKVMFPNTKFLGYSTKIHMIHFLFLRTSINYLLLNLAVADMTVATFFVLHYIFIHTFTHPDGMMGNVMCKFLTGGNLAWVGGAASVVTLVAIAIERYYVVMYPHGKKRMLTNRKLKVGKDTL